MNNYYAAFRGRKLLLAENSEMVEGISLPAVALGHIRHKRHPFASVCANRKQASDTGIEHQFFAISSNTHTSIGRRERLRRQETATSIEIAFVVSVQARIKRELSRDIKKGRV